MSSEDQTPESSPEPSPTHNSPEASTLTCDRRRAIEGGKGGDGESVKGDIVLQREIKSGLTDSVIS